MSHCRSALNRWCCSSNAHLPLATKDERKCARLQMDFRSVVTVSSCVFASEVPFSEPEATISLIHRTPQLVPANTGGGRSPGAQQIPLKIHLNANYSNPEEHLNRPRFKIASGKIS